MDKARRAINLEPKQSDLQPIESPSSSSSSNFDSLTGMRKRKFTAVADATPDKSEEVLWDKMDQSDYERGVVREVVGGIIMPAKFNVLVFWANPLIKAKFRARFRVFLGNFAAINHEATSESTFSEAGRAFTKSRTSLDPQQLCDHVVCCSGERSAPTSSDDVLAMYKKIAAEKLARKAAAGAAAAESAAAAAASAAATAATAAAVAAAANAAAVIAGLS
jgi:hypothetical protein